MNSMNTLGEKLECRFKHTFLSNSESRERFLLDECSNAPKEFSPTVRRLKFISKLMCYFGPKVEAVILSGSMGYGRFFSVEDSSSRCSDVDLLILTNSESQPLLECPGWRMLGVESKASFYMNILMDLAQIPCGLVAFHFNTGYGFDVSLTIIPENNSEGILLADHNSSHQIMFLNDIKIAGYNTLKDFAGNDFVTDEIIASPYKGNLFMHQIASSYSNNGLWVPNGFQGLCLPDFLPLSDTNGVGWKILRSLRNIYTDHEFELISKGTKANFLLSHVRRPRISPWLVSSSMQECFIS